MYGYLTKSLSAATPRTDGGEAFVSILNVKRSETSTGISNCVRYQKCLSKDVERACDTQTLNCMLLGCRYGANFVIL